MSTSIPTATRLDAKVQEFLAQQRIAVAGITRGEDGSANLIYRKLKSTGHQVFAVNPNADSFDGEPCYPNLQAIPGGVDGVVIVTRPEVTEKIVRQCAEASVSRVWMHQSLVSAGTSVSADAVAFCHDHNISVIAGACPLMYCTPVDFGHRCMRWMLGVSGKLPK